MRETEMEELIKEWELFSLQKLYIISDR
jgi:hypothetical protein